MFIDAKLDIMIVTFINGGVNVKPEPTLTPSALEVEIGKAEGERKEEVIIPVSFKEMTEGGVNSCEFTLTFEQEDIEVQEVTAGDIVVNLAENFSTVIDNNNGTVKFLFAGETINADGEFARMRVRIKEEAEIGFSQVELTEKSFIGGNLIAMIVTPNEDGGVEVKPTPTPEPTPEPTPDPTPEPTPPSGLDVWEDWEEVVWNREGWVSAKYNWGTNQPSYTTDEWCSHGSNSFKLPKIIGNSYAYTELILNYKDDSLKLDINSKAKLMLDVHISESDAFSGVEAQLLMQFAEGGEQYLSDKVTVPEGEDVTVTFDLETLEAYSGNKIPQETALNVYWLKFSFIGLVDNGGSTDSADIYVDYLRCEY